VRLWHRGTRGNLDCAAIGWRLAGTGCA